MMDKKYYNETKYNNVTKIVTLSKSTLQINYV